MNTLFILPICSNFTLKNKNTNKSQTWNISCSFAFQESKLSVVKQINDGKRHINQFPNESFALIIDGKSLTYALDDDTKQMFLNLAIGCGSVICCRSSPKQKALVRSLLYYLNRKLYSYNALFLVMFELCM